MIGAGVGGAVSGSLNFGGFLGGAVSGGAGGGAAGFAGGAANAWWMQGANFGEGLTAGLIGGGIGLASGAVLGGLSRGIADHRNGYSFWNGKKTLTFGLSNQNTRDIVSNYSTSSAAAENDLLLKERMNNMYGVSEGDFGIEKITTMGDNRYSVNTDGLFVKNSTNEIIGGYADLISNGKTDFHVSPYYTLTPDDVMFRVVAGHELVHTYHNFVLPEVDQVMTERVAYQYSSDVLVANGRLVDYANAMRWGSTYLQYRGSYPSQYNIPRSIFRFF